MSDGSEGDGPVGMTCIDISGSSRERGQAQGEQLREVIGETFGLWLERIGARHSIEPGAYLATFLQETDHLEAIRAWTPHLLEEVEGIAEGSGQPLSTVLSYNLMDEEWFYAEQRCSRDPRGCTAAAFTTSEGRIVIGQTMDIPSVHDGSQTVIRHTGTDGTYVTCFTTAGMLVLMGANARGVGIVVNNLAMLPASAMGLPVAFVMRGALDHGTAQEAAGFVRSVPHAIGQHYLIGGSDGLVSLEASTSGVVRDHDVSTSAVHTNHPLVSFDVDADAEESYARSNCRRRFERMAEMLPSLGSRNDLETALCDTLAPISRAPAHGFMTFGAMVAVLSVPPGLSFAGGPPHLRSFQTVRWTSTARNHRSANGEDRYR